VRDDLVTIIGKQKSLTHVLVTTFNIDFIFIENIILRRLRSCGHPSLTVFADADEAAAAYASQARWLSTIGRHYRVVPVRMEPGYRFHPKVVLLSGEDSARLFIGSGNLTFGGMRQNEESWLEFESATDGTSVFEASRRFFEGILDRLTREHPARGDVSEAFAADKHAWARELHEADGLVWKVGSGSALAEQMIEQVSSAPIERITIASPYYDDEAAGLRVLRSRWPAAEIVAIVQPDRCGLTATAWDTLPVPKRIVPMESDRGTEATPFVHAKCYAFTSGDETTVFVGSANCTRAALTIPGRSGNAEILARFSLKTSEVESVLLAGLKFTDEAIELSAEQADAEQAVSTDVHSLTVEHARYFAGELLVRFHSSGVADDLELIADDLTLAGADLHADESTVKARGLACPGSVRLRGTVNGERTTSPPRWVDDELRLSASSQQRAIAGAISQHMSAESWSIKGWSEVLRLMSDHLVQCPGTLERPTLDSPSTGAEADTIPADAFFSDDYRLPRRGHAGMPLDDATRISGLGGLLARYLGDHNDSQAAESDDAEDEDTVDRAEDIRQQDGTPPARRKHDPSAAERRRAKRVASKVVDRITHPSFIIERPSALLPSDLAITAVLLTSGHVEGWLDPSDFVDLTYRIWTHLFFDASSPEHRTADLLGALPARIRSSASPGEFRENVATVELAAALAIWCLSVPDDVEHNERARFTLATRLAVAHAPWLWITPDREAFAEEMRQIATRTGWLGDDAAQHWDVILSRWEQIYSQGRSLARFEAIMFGQDLEMVREALPVDEVTAGSLLWAGPKLGFCVLRQGAHRCRGGDPVPIMTLRSTGRETRIARRFVLPFGPLITHVGGLAEADALALRAFERTLLEA